MPTFLADTELQLCIRAGKPGKSKMPVGFEPNRRERESADFGEFLAKMLAMFTHCTANGLRCSCFHVSRIPCSHSWTTGATATTHHPLYPSCPPSHLAVHSINGKCFGCHHLHSKYVFGRWPTKQNTNILPNCLLALSMCLYINVYEHMLYLYIWKFASAKSHLQQIYNNNNAYYLC